MRNATRSRLSCSLQTADGFPVLASVPPTGNISAVRLFFRLASFESEIVRVVYLFYYFFLFTFSSFDA